MPRIAAPVPLPAPFDGMNTRDGIAALKPSEARELVNWQPEGNAVQCRKGQAPYSTGGQDSNPVKTLASYDGLTSKQLIGVNGGRIWDFTSATAIELYNGNYADNRFQTENYVNRLFGVNGIDTPWVYDGSTVSATGFSGSGLTLTNLNNIRKVRNRLWFCENDSADVWYGDVGSIAGTLTKFQLSQVVAGGTCVAIGAHSQDAGAGPDDYTVFVMSTGEVVLYSGDPSTTFSKVGNYAMPPPVGKQCLVNIGGPLAVLTSIGLVPLQAAVAGLAFDLLAIGNFGKIGPSIRDDVTSYSMNDGWHAVNNDGKIIINVPLSSTTARQWVFNTLKGAWTQWTGYNAGAFCVQNSVLYYGLLSDGQVWKQWGTTDNGEAIDLTAKCAFSSLPQGGALKVSGIRFEFSLDGTVSGQYGIDTDYIEREVTTPVITLARSVSSTPWGSPWGSDWSDSKQDSGKWFSVFGEGHSAAPVLYATANVTSLNWLGSDLQVRPIGPFSVSGR